MAVTSAKAHALLKLNEKETLTVVIALEEYANAEEDSGNLSKAHLADRIVARLEASSKHREKLKREAEERSRDPLYTPGPTPRPRSKGQPSPVGQIVGPGTVEDDDILDLTDFKFKT